MFQVLLSVLLRYCFVVLCYGAIAVLCSITLCYYCVKWFVLRYLCIVLFVLFMSCVSCVIVLVVLLLLRIVLFDCGGRVVVC